MEDLVTEKQAAEELFGDRNKALLLRNWRNQKIGPAYVKIGRLVRYRRSALHDYIERRTRQTRDSADAVR